MYTIVEKKLGHKEGQRYRSTMQALYVVAACSSHDEAMSNSEACSIVHNQGIIGLGN